MCSAQFQFILVECDENNLTAKTATWFKLNKYETFEGAQMIIKFISLQFCFKVNPIDVQQHILQKIMQDITQD